MNHLDLRPLSLGEILDRTFTLYKTHFILFLALAGIPRLPSLGIALAQAQVTGDAALQGPAMLAFPTSTFVALALGAMVAAIVGYLFSQGGSLIAVSELYLGRSITIAQAFRRVASDIWVLVGVVILNLLAIFAGFIALIIPGIYLLFRLFVCVPVALIEQKNPADALSRSFALTKGFMGRAIVIIVLYLALSLGFAALIQVPILAGVAASANDPAALRIWLSAQALLGGIFEILLTPILLIATAIYYYDLRVRKEAFDLQVMMDPEGANIGRVSYSVVPPPLNLPPPPQ